MLQFPRSVRLAAWGTAALRGDATIAEALRWILGDDEPHALLDGDRLVSAPGEGGGEGLGHLLSALRLRGVRGLRVVLPAPGDMRGLPGPARFNLAAVEAGEAVLTEPSAPGTPGPLRLGLVPLVTEFGSTWEPGATVTWRVEAVDDRLVDDPASLPEADRELREAMTGATEALAALDVARWRPDAAARIALLRDGGLPAGALPPSASPRSCSVLATAARVQAIVALAREDDGGAVTGFEATSRAHTLQDLERVSRRAVAAAVNGALEPS